MNHEALLATAGERIVRAALVGAGQFGESLIGQAERIPRLSLPVVCDRDVDRVRRTLAQAGIAESRFRICENAADAARVVSEGLTAVVPEAAWVAGLEVDIVVEATGVPEVSAATAVASIDAGLHVAMVTKETESVIGPWLHARARSAGVQYTPVDGDQPSLLLGLLSWARTLGLHVVCAGKSSEYDFVWDAATSSVDWRGERFPVDDLAPLWHLGDAPATTLAARASRMAAIPQRTVPDLCEMLVVINHSDLAPASSTLGVPIARPGELPEILRPATAGGTLAGEGVVEVFNCLRRPDELSFAGGVFIVVRCDGAETWSVLAGKGHPVSNDGAHALLYNAQHLLGVEAPMSLFEACLLNLPSGSTAPRQRYDLIARAARDLMAGEVFTVDDAHHHEMSALTPAIEAFRPIGTNGPVPYYLLEGRTVQRDMARGEILTADCVDVPGDSVLWRYRTEMDGSMQRD